jgi:hypothetical protein
MVDISNRIKVLAGIEQGCIYNFSPNDGVINHYYVVLNKTPKHDEEINLAVFTTKKDNVLRFIELKKLDKNTYVDIEKKEINFLPVRDNMGIDCNRLVYVNKEKLIELIDNSGGSCNYPVLKKSVLEKVIKGVKLSRMVKPSV